MMLEEMSKSIQAVRFYRVDVDKHAMLSRAYSHKTLPEIVLVKNGAEFLVLEGDVSQDEVRNGLQTLIVVSR
jgi:thioredoxin 1